MRKFILIIICLSIKLFCTAADLTPKDSVRKHQYISKKKLVSMIDSMFDLEFVSAKEIDQLNYYASLLSVNKKDSIRISEFNLYELSFYSAAGLLQGAFHLPAFNQAKGVPDLVIVVLA